MKQLDIAGRITLPKEIRERNGFKPNDFFEIFERDDEIVLKPTQVKYKVNESQMMIIRKLYGIVKDTDVLEDSELATLREICKFTDMVCPNCNENLYLTSDNSYKCMNCGE